MEQIFFEFLFPKIRRPICLGWGRWPKGNPRCIPQGRSMTWLPPAKRSWSIYLFFGFWPSSRASSMSRRTCVSPRMGVSLYVSGCTARYVHACAYVIWLGYLWCNVSGQRRVYLLPEGRTLSAVRENCALKNVSAHHVVLSFLVLASSPSFFFYLSFSFSTFVYGVGCACVVAQTQSGR